MLARLVANEACLSLLLVVEVVETVDATVVLILHLDHVPVLPESLRVSENPVLMK